jgi:hypothetical protein
VQSWQRPMIGYTVCAVHNGDPPSSTIPSTIYHLTSAGSRPVSHIESDRRLPWEFIMQFYPHPKTPNPFSILYPITNTWEEHPRENPHSKHSQTLDSNIKTNPAYLITRSIFKLTIDTFYKGDQYCFMCLGNSLKTLQHTMPMGLISCSDWKQGNRRWVGGGNNLFYIDTFMPVPVAARSKAWVCGRSPAEIVCSNPTGGMDVCCECRV